MRPAGTVRIRGVASAIFRGFIDHQERLLEVFLSRDSWLVLGRGLSASSYDIGQPMDLKMSPFIRLGPDERMKLFDILLSEIRFAGTRCTGYLVSG